MPLPQQSRDRGFILAVQLPKVLKPGTSHEGVVPDLPATTHHLRSRNLLDRCGGSLRLTEYATSLADIANTAHYANELKRLSRHGKFVNAARKVAISPNDDEALQTARKAISDLELGGKRYPIISARDLLSMDLPPVRFVVDGLLPEGFTILAGKPKIGKSWLVLTLACAIALGREPLGAFSAEPGDVLYVATEDSEQRLQSRLRHILVEPARNHGRLDLSMDFPRLGDGLEERVENWARQKDNPRLVILDTLGRIRPNRANGSGPTYADDTL